MIQYYEKYRHRIALGDQDLINIFFHYYPGIREEYVNELQRNPTLSLYLDLRSWDRGGLSRALKFSY